MLDRTAFQARLEANAVRAASTRVTLPSDGTEILLRAPNKEQVQRSWAAAGGDEDSDLVGMVNLLKFCLVDEDDHPLPRNFAEARGWFNTLATDDATAVMEALTEVISDLAPAEGEDPTEAGKAS